MDKHTKKTAGALGGQSTLARYGHLHFANIGRRGAAEFHRRYKLEPFALNDFRIVRRDTGETVSFLSGKVF
jgi:hypothetical protein